MKGAQVLPPNARPIFDRAVELGMMRMTVIIDLAAGPEGQDIGYNLYEPSFSSPMRHQTAAIPFTITRHART